jgi:hypothetical protein
VCIHTHTHLCIYTCIHVYQEFGGIEFTLFYSLPFEHVNNTRPPPPAQRRLLVSEFAPDRYDGYVSTVSSGEAGGISEAGTLGGYFVFCIYNHTHTHTHTQAHTNTNTNTHKHTHTNTHTHKHSLTHTNTLLNRWVLWPIDLEFVDGGGCRASKRGGGGAGS